ncbi:MAG: antibiotic biosynthesis monooxygenase [bacterium]|nr:antibiotic biosynthesis monooxygenase [bacterium]MCP5071167.1 antibiotic biosynthesis monooxygenase [bacterium]
MVVVTNRIPIAEGCESDFEDRFEKRIHLVDESPGFVRNEVHRPRPMKFDHESGEWRPDPDGEGYYEIKTWWRSIDDFVAWTRSAAFAEAHKRAAPKEMFRGANIVDIHEVFQSSDLDVSRDV